LNEDAVLNQPYAWSGTWNKFETTSSSEVWRLNRGLGTREFVDKIKFLHLKDALRAAQAHVRRDSEIWLFINELVKSGQEIAAGQVEVSSKRLVWWLPDGRRGARLNLEGRQIEMLVLNRFIDIVGRNRILARMKLHDKNHAMSICKASTLEEMRSPIPIFGATDTRA
jgi:hypothetical protein